MWRLIWAIPTWIAFQLLVFIPLCLIGWILIPLAAAVGAWQATPRPGRTNEDIVHFTWPFMFVWDNYEDGIANANYWKAPNLFLQIVYWSAIRNPVNNLRIVPYLSCKIDPARVCFIGSFTKKDWRSTQNGIEDTDSDWDKQTKKYDTKIPHWFFAWQGLYSNFYWQFNLFGKLRRFWIGWKIYPTSIYKVPEYQKRGAGFALQWKVVK